MATTKAYEIGQLAGQLDVDSVGDITLTGNLDVSYSGFDSDFAAKTTTNLTEGDNLYYTTARADSDATVAAIAAISVTDAGGDGSLTYSDGAITYTGPSAAETRAHFSAGTGISINSGQISVNSSDNVTFADITTTGVLNGPATFYIDPAPVDSAGGLLVIRGDLQVDGTTTTVNSTTVTINDKNIVLADSAANAAEADGAGITVEGANATITYDAANDEWDFNKDINVTGNITVSGTVDGVDIASRDSTLTSTTTTANAALPKAGGTMTGNLNLGDSVKAIFGAGSDLQIYHDGSHARLRETTGDFRIQTTSGGVNALVAKQNAEVEIAYAGSTKLVTTSTGVDITGTLTSDGLTVEGSAFIGPSGYQSIFSNSVGNNSAIIYSSTGNMEFRGTSTDYYQLFLKSGGNVGIGTDDPDAKLEVIGSQTIANDNGFFAATLAEVSDYRMALKISPTRSGQTKGITLGAIGGAALTGIQAYDTSDNTSNPLSLNALGGNVGIGTNSPTHALHVEATTAVPFKIKSTSTSGTGLYLDNDRSGSKTFGILSGNVAAGYFNIKDEDAGVNRFVISSSGDVGIGTTSPAHKLDVDGAIATRQVRHSIRPTLNLDFANSKELDPRITFYRDSIATYYDSKGVLRYANVNKPRFDHDPATGESKGLLIEEARTNLTDKNNRFNDWHGRNRVDFIENAAKSPDGYYNATKVIDAPNGADARHEFWRNFSAVSGTTYTFSIYAKAEEHTMFEFVWYGDNGVFSGQTRFDLDAETITLGPATRGTITHVRDGWYKCEASRVSGATAAGYYGIYMVEESTGDSSYVGLNDGGLYFFGAQFEEGDFPTSYIPSDTRFTSRSSVATHYDETGILRTAPANSPRYGYKYDGRKWVETGLILENAATNYVPVYPDLVNRGAAVDLTLNATTAPDGSNAHLFKPTTTSTIHRIGYYGDPSLGAGNICFSVYLKAGGYRYVGLNNYHSGSKAAGFDLETGTITTIGAGCNAFIEEVTNGWYRCSVSYVTTTTNDTPNIEIRETSGSGYQSFAGDGTSGIYAWGLQMENSLAASSYIYTTNGSTATRSADIASSVAYTRPHDVAYIDKIQNKDWFDTEKGTIYADADAYGMDDAVVVGINDGSARGIRNWWISSTTEVRSAAYGGSNYTGLHYYSGIDSIAPHKMATAYSYEDATYVSALDGSTPQSTTSWAGIVTNPTTLWLGGETTTSRPFTGAIKRVAYYGEALSTAELQALTENN